MSDPCKRTWYLRELDLFRDLSEPEIDELAQALGSQTFKPGDLIVTPDHPPERVYIVIEGTVRLFQRGPDGREVTADVIGRGRLFGISALFGPPGDGLLAEAVTPVTVCVADADGFMRLVSRWPKVMFMLALQVARRLVEVEEQLERFGSGNARLRLAATLSRLASDTHEAHPGGGRSIRPPLTHRELAARIGSRRETVTRHLAALETDGYIRREGRRLIILDLPGLRALAGEFVAADDFDPGPGRTGR